MHPQTNGIVENFHRCLKDVLTGFVDWYSDDWDEALPFCYLPIMKFQLQRMVLVHLSLCMVVISMVLQVLFLITGGKMKESKCRSLLCYILRLFVIKYSVL